MIEISDHAASRLRTISEERGEPDKVYRIYLDGFG